MIGQLRRADVKDVGADLLNKFSAFEQHDGRPTAALAKAV
jgi:hypothetical protein